MGSHTYHSVLIALENGNLSVLFGVENGILEDHSVLFAVEYGTLKDQIVLLVVENGILKAHSV